MSKLGLIACLCAAVFHGWGQSLEISPYRVMVDESATIRASGLTPNERITIAAELIDGADVHWTSRAEFMVDAQGLIDVSKQAPVGGSYKDISALGLVWSMMPHGRSASGYSPPRGLGIQTIEFQLMRKNARLASAQLEQASIGEGVRRLAVREAGLRGTLFLPAAKESRPGVLVLGGSEGGLPARRAAWLASHGYVALALAYFHFEDLPQDLAAIPLEYFGHALGWMARRPEILPDRLAVMGGSRGGELSLQLGSMHPQIRAVVAYVPADARHGSFPAGARVPYAWTWQGMPLAFVSGRGGGNRLGATIAAERTEGPVMMISGGSDGVWESSSMADSVVERLKHAHFTYEVEHLKYPHAGHTAGRPEIVPAWQGTGNNRISGRTMHAGGSTEGNAASSIDAIPKVLDFLQRALRP